MLIPLPNPQQPSRNPGRESRLWHDGTRYTPSFGCASCLDRAVCGGLKLNSPLFDCLGFCCHKPASCDAVCRNRPDEFVRRVREVNGFALDNVPRAPVLAAPLLPALVPLLYHGSKRTVPFQAPAVCLPMYSVIRRHNGGIRYANAIDLANGFGVTLNVPVMLTGTATDRPLERWWSLGSRRRDGIRALRDLGVALVTTPNYSLFIDQPRWDDLHSMKRIAIVHEEFLSEGLPAALHLNARTERDWERWGLYIAARPEITHVAFEFATGAGWSGRIAWHLEQLEQLAAAVERPLHLVVRGGAKMLPALTRVFSRVTFLDTTVFMKTQSRQRALLSAEGSLNWLPSPTAVTEPVDALLTENWQVVAAAHARVANRPPSALQAAG
jgi:hypothetical protein